MSGRPDVTKFDRVMRHAAGVGTLVLTGALFAGAYYVEEKGMAFLFAAFALAPGYAAWQYLRFLSGTRR